MFSTRKSLLLLSVALLIGLGLACSGDGTSTQPDQGEPPGPPLTSVTIPEAMQTSDDPMARLVVGYVGMVNALSGYGSYFTPPASSCFGGGLLGSGPTWTYTWTAEGLTITLTIVESDETYVWDVVLSGSDGTHSYDDWLFIHAEQSKDGASGVVRVYKPVTDDVATVWEWNVDESQAYHFVLTFYGEGEQGRVILSSYADGSGNLGLYTYVDGTYQLMLRAEWASDGSGEWWTYENGEETGHGTWT